MTVPSADFAVSISDYEPLLIAATSSGLSLIAAAAMFSSACPGEPVPGMGRIWGELASSQARTTWWVLTPCRWAAWATAGFLSASWTGLKLYEHPLVEFDARAKGESVEVIIRPRFSDPPVHTYYFEMHPRDLDDAQFEWAFQRQLFDCLHDYLRALFIRTPQHRREHQQMEREGKL